MYEEKGSLFIKLIIKVNEKSIWIIYTKDFVVFYQVCVENMLMVKNNFDAFWDTLPPKYLSQ